MAIDSNALDSIHAAIKSYSGETVSNKKEQSDLLSAINSNSQGLIKQTRYKTEFEEKMKIANSSEDYVVYAVSICHKISHQDCHDLSSMIA